MAGFSNYTANIMLDYILRGNTLGSTAPANHYVALFFADPTDANTTSNEITGAWYARQLCNSWNMTGSDIAANSNQLTWSAVTGSAVTATHFGIYDSLTAGNLLCSGALTSPSTLNVNDIFTFAAGQLSFTAV